MEKKICEYQGHYLEFDDEVGEIDTLKCELFVNECNYEESCYCDEEEKNNCRLRKYAEYIKNKNNEIRQLKEENSNYKKEVEKVGFIKRQLSYLLSKLEE